MTTETKKVLGIIGGTLAGAVLVAGFITGPDSQASTDEAAPQATTTTTEAPRTTKAHTTPDAENFKDAWVQSYRDTYGATPNVGGDSYAVYTLAQEMLRDYIVLRAEYGARTCDDVGAFWRTFDSVSQETTALIAFSQGYFAERPGWSDLETFRDNDIQCGWA